jgi:hypothetical protein
MSRRQGQSKVSANNDTSGSSELTTKTFLEVQFDDIFAHSFHYFIAQDK